MTDYLIIGGGLAGCVVATRLKEKEPSASVTVVEAGPDQHDHEWITEPMGTLNLHFSDMEYNYKTAPQKNYDSREVFIAGGKLLSGSSCVNYGMWTRGGRSDYDLWADLVGDKRWSYDGMLPYFKRTETHHDSESVDKTQHGFDGPIHTTAAARHYPLRDEMKRAFLTSGLEWKYDANGGEPIGISPYTENWRAAKRQPSGQAYGLKGVEVLLGRFVRRIIIEGGAATGAELLDGTKILARKEVILSCGALRSPQLLMLSGIGPRAELQKQGISQVTESPEVGSGLSDHCSVALVWKVKHPEKSVTAMSPGWTDPTYFHGMPVDLVLTANAPAEKVKVGLAQDGVADAVGKAHLQADRGHIEIVPIYAPMESPLTDINAPFDGTCLTIGVLNLLPTSRGSVTLASADPTADPLIDPNYYATETDRIVMREGMRMALRIIESPEGQEIFGDEHVPHSLPALTSTSPDADLDARVRKVAATWFHPTGTCAMGKVVDNDLRVVGVERLRVVDASIMPCPIGAHYQVVTYAVAEQAADIIAAAHA